MAAPTPIGKYRQEIIQRKEAEKAKAALQAREKAKVQAMAKKIGQFTLLLQAIEAEVKNLSNIPQGEQRNKKKQELVKQYMPVIEEYIQSGEEYKNLVLVQVMIWLFDIGEIDKALEVAGIAVEQNQPMPERFKSTLKTFVADAFKEWVEKQLTAKHSVEPYFSEMLNDVLEWDIHEKIKLKYLVTAAKLADENEDIDKALEYCNKAQDLDPKAKVKGLKEKLEKAIALREEQKKAAEARPEETQTD